MWHPNSWVKFTSIQLPSYDSDKLKLVKNKLKTLPPLINWKHIESLKNLLMLAEQNKAFILQLGECSERFKDSVNKKFMENFVFFLKKIATLIENELQIPVIKIGRIAGQYAKPRTNLVEKNNIGVFKGEIINGFSLTAKNRKANPFRMLLAYCASKQALNSLYEIYNKIQLPSIKPTDLELNNDLFIYTSHEVLLLQYEEALTRLVQKKGYYNLSAHMVWLGARTNHIDSPHIEYLQGINNPIGIKVYEKISPNDLVKLIQQLNPNNNSGKIILIIRLQNQAIDKYLSLYIKAIKKSKLNVSFICDPMHSNTKVVNGYKVRYFSDLIENIKKFIFVCKNNKITPQGIHLEATFLNVTECIGGVKNKVDETKISNNYQTTCDPRLNYNQTIELVTDALNAMHK